MARGYPGAFGGKLNAPYVWLPLCALFAIPFLSIRRWRRLIHLDIAVLLAFGISHIFFNDANISASVPLAYPVLAYLLARLLWEGFRPRRERGPLLPHIPWTWLALALVFLVGFRVALNVVDSSVIDVGYAGVIGADRIEHHRGLYSGTSLAPDNPHGDTYGPVNYLLYVPFEQIFPWSGHWDTLPAAHAAALTFDLLTIMGLFLLGRRLRNNELGVVLAYAWAAYPYTLFTLDSNSNDTIVAMMLVYALLFLRSPPLRGVFVGLGAAAKFVPLALAPLFATGTGERRWRSAAMVLAVVAFVGVVTLAPFLPHEGLRHVYDRTLGSQIGRTSPFSIWGEHPGLKPLWTAVKVLVAGLAVLVAFVPERKTPVQVAALGAAVLVALQIALAHWFYLYIVWFAPFALLAFFGPYQTGVSPPEAEAARSQSPGHPAPPRSAPHSATGHPAPSRTSPASG
jgi:multisubunit Na+/H+ antiporter MnhF subunit